MSELTTSDAVNKVIGAILAVAGLCGLHFNIEYSGWVLAIGLILVL